MTFRQIIHVAICVIVSLILAGVGTRYIHPHWLFAVVYSLQLHAGVACIAMMLLAVVLARSLPSYLLLALSLAITGHAVFIGWQLAAPQAGAENAAPHFRLLSFNILSENYENGEAIARMIASSGADIVNIMEAEPIQSHLSQLNQAYPYRIGCGVLTQNCDQLMLSRVPLHNATVRSLSPIFGDRFILAEADLGGRRIHVGGIHTTKPYFDNFLTFELLRAALAITDLDGPLILSGDFNAASIAPNMSAFLRWTGLRPSPREPATWPVRLGALGLAIDHIYVREPLAITSLSRLPQSYGSNHAGLVADVVIGP